MKKENAVSRRTGVVLGTLLAVWSVGLLGASCDKKAASEPGPVGIAPPPDPKAGAADATAAKPKTPPEAVAGVDLSALAEGKQAVFHALVDKLQSPCGKAESLRASVKDPSCKRAAFAARYVARKVGEDLPSDAISENYEARYVSDTKYGFDVKEAPSIGPKTAPVTIVEFFDYGCPHCKLFAPVLEDLAAEFPQDLVIYYKHFPLGGHPNSVPAAMGAVAAAKQGKFKAMHKALFDGQDDQSPEAIEKMAVAVGCDMKKWKTDMAAARSRVDADHAEGEKAELKGTPQVYVMGRKWPENDPLTPEELAEWVREELAVNR